MLSGFLVDFSWGKWGMRFGLATRWFGWANRQVHEEQSRHSLAQGWPEQELPQPGISPTHSRTPPILTYQAGDEEDANECQSNLLKDLNPIVSSILSAPSLS